MDQDETFFTSCHNTERGVLGELFPDKSIHNMRSLIELICTSTSDELDALALPRQREPGSPLCDILNNVFVVAPLDLPELPIRSQSENLESFLSLRFVKSPTSLNASKPIVSFPKNPSQAENMCIWDEFAKPIWNWLYQWLGEQLFSFLFDSCYLFRSLPKNNFLQLLGPSLQQTKSRLISSAPSTTLAETNPSAPLANSLVMHLSDHQLRLNRWKKKRRFSDTFGSMDMDIAPDGVQLDAGTIQEEHMIGIESALKSPKQGESATTSPIALDPSKSNDSPSSVSKNTKKRPRLTGFSPTPSPYKPLFSIFQRHTMMYHYSKRISYGLSSGWEGTKMLQDEDGPQKLVTWIFGAYFAQQVNHVTPTLKGLLHRTSKIKFRSILDRTCPYTPKEPSLSVLQSPSSSAPLKTQDQPKAHSTMRASVVNRLDPTPSRSEEVLPNASIAFQSEHPLLMSSGIKCLSPKPTSSWNQPHERSEKTILTQTTSSGSEGLESARSEYFDMNNEEDYMISLLIEPNPDPLQGMKVEDLVSRSSSHFQVGSFLCKIINTAIPRELIGSHYNWELLEMKIQHFVSLNRFDIISSKHILEGFKITEIPWCYGHLSPKARVSAQDTQRATLWFHQFLCWLFNNFIMVLIRTNFYVTETMAHRNKLFYYRKEVWAALHRLGFESLLSRDIFTPIQESTALAILRNRELGVCKLRFVPKPTGLRPIVNMKKKFANPTLPGASASINSTLASIHAVLTYETQRSPRELLLSSFLSLENVHAALCSFKESLSKLSSSLPPLYFVKVDVVAAFDEIQQGKLLAILFRDVLKLEKYLSITSSKLSALKGAWRHKALKSIVGVHQDVGITELLEPHLSKMSEAIFSCTTIDSAILANEKLIELIEDHVTRHLIKHGENYFQQTKGIPQGSILSSMLCSLYFANLEKCYLNEFLECRKDSTGTPLESSILIRWIDDFLYITTNKEKAIKYFEKMHGGFDDFGTRCNEAKSIVNFPMQYQGCDIANVSTDTNLIQDTQFSEEGDEENEEVLVTTHEIVWCGWLFNTRTLEVRRSIPTRIKMRDWITVTFERPGKSMLDKLKSSMKSTTRLIFYDSRFASRQTMLESIFDAFAWAALRMMSLERAMQYPTSVSSTPGSQLPNPKFILDLILSLAQKFTSSLWKRLNGANARELNVQTSINMRDAEAMAIYSMCSMLKGREQYKPVVEALKQMIKLNESKKQSHSTTLEYHLAVTNRKGLFANAKI